MIDKEKLLKFLKKGKEEIWEMIDETSTSETDGQAPSAILNQLSYIEFKIREGEFDFPLKSGDLEKRAAFLRRGIYEFSKISINETSPFCMCGQCKGIVIYEYNTDEGYEEIVIFEDDFDKAIDSAINLLEKRGVKWRYQK